ncbi:MAG: hypothetical protein AAGD25_26270 [Cyanobacteria bacterium P01_F01_bin.150]
MDKYQEWESDRPYWWLEKRSHGREIARMGKRSPLLIKGAIAQWINIRNGKAIAPIVVGRIDRTIKR